MLLKVYFQIPTKKVSGKTSKQPAKDQEEHGPVNNSKVSRNLTELSCLSYSPRHFSRSSTKSLSYVVSSLRFQHLSNIFCRMSKW